MLRKNVFKYIPLGCFKMLREGIKTNFTRMELLISKQGTSLSLIEITSTVCTCTKLCHHLFTKCMVIIWKTHSWDHSRPSSPASLEITCDKWWYKRKAQIVFSKLLYQSKVRGQTCIFGPPFRLPSKWSPWKTEIRVGVVSTNDLAPDPMKFTKQNI